MFKINKETKQVEFNFSKKLSKKQMIMISKMRQDDKISYIQSLIGVKKKFWNLERFQTGGRDALASKDKGSVLDKFNSMLNNGHGTLHRPTSNKGQWYGVEIECLIPRDDDQIECDDCGGSGRFTDYDEDGNEIGDSECSSCDGSGYIGERTDVHSELRQAFKREKLTLISVKSDGSLHEDGHIGVEVTVLFNADHGFDKINKVCKILRDFNAVVNKTCGLHVHLDATNLDTLSAKKLGKKFGFCLPVLSQLVPLSRRNNSFCRMGVSRLRGERYFAVNMTSYSKHKTIEIRLHSGTVDADKIINWVKLLNSIRLSVITSKLSSLQDLLDAVNASDAMATYLDSRFTKFNPDIAPTPSQQRRLDNELSQDVAV